MENDDVTYLHAPIRIKYLSLDVMTVGWLFDCLIVWPLSIKCDRTTTTQSRLSRLTELVILFIDNKMLLFFIFNLHLISIFYIEKYFRFQVKLLWTYKTSKLWLCCEFVLFNCLFVYIWIIDCSFKKPSPFGRNTLSLCICSQVCICSAPCLFVCAHAWTCSVSLCEVWM